MTSSKRRARGVFRLGTAMFSIGSGCGVLMMLGTLGCGGSQKKTEPKKSYAQTAKDAYFEAMRDFEDEDCIAAEPAFKKISQKYPYSKYAPLAELRSADCKIIDGKYIEGIAEYDEFVRRHPTHAGVPYAKFKIAKAHYAQIPDEWLLSPPAHERDQGQTRQALRQLQRYVVEYPDDKHVPEAEKMIRESLTMLARHELYVAKFYLSRDKLQAAAGRLEVLRRAYRGASIEPEALWLCGDVYRQLKRNQEASDVFRELAERFPQTSYGRRARKALAQGR
jgi:outer membrane protein assembly factor BamD